MALIKPTETFGNREPPARESNEQYLFLLEYYVYRVRGERLGKLNRMFFVPTRVSVKFLSFDDEDEMSVTPVDPMFEPQAGIADEVETLNAGRSIMFAIDRASVIGKTMELRLGITVKKKMPESIRPDVVVGRGEIDMTRHFAALRKEMLQCWHTDYPPPKVFEGSVEIFNENDDNGATGSVDMYVRLSGFGQTIVTEIESPEASPGSPEKATSAYVFKSVENKSEDKRLLAYECRLVGTGKMNFDDSSTNLPTAGDGGGCGVCSPPPRRDCSPCGIPGGAGIRHDDDPLDTILRGNVLTSSWNPEASSRESPYEGSQETSKLYRHSRDLPIQSSRGPSEPCGRAVVLKVSGLLDVDDPDGSARRNPTVTLADRTTNERDPEHDVFILRIGKKGIVGADEKSDIQLEMRTPKGPERRPPIRYETREMQTEDDTLGKTKDSKASKGKGKKKK